MNPDLDRLQPYPFEKLALLHEKLTPADMPLVDLSIGEPKHPVSPPLRQAMADALDGISRYPTTRGDLALRETIACWVSRRFALPGKSVDPTRHVLPVNGTREALFSIGLAVLDRTAKEPLVLTPNPFYQIYEGATIMGGGRLLPVSATAENGFLPDYGALPAEVLDRVQLAYLCTPSNPTGSVYDIEALKRLIELADRHDFIIASDECYSEIWYDTPPAGILQACAEMGRHDYRRCLAFHSLSKRSNMPGARSGFVAGDADILARYFSLRTYTGCAMAPFIQQASIAAWADETHVEENRRLYRQKLALAREILTPKMEVTSPAASFYLWLKVPGGGEAFASRLMEEVHVRVLPGGYLGRVSRSGENPGDPYIRVALVASVEETGEGMRRMASLL